MTNLSFTYSLSELPSSQHRAGLAGLVLMIDFVRRNPNRKGTLSYENLGASGVTILFDKEGLQEIFCELYAAIEVEKPEKKIRTKKNKNGEKDPVPPLREEIGEDGKTLYVYQQTEPLGRIIDEWDSSDKKLWVKLWRNFLWEIPRGNPQARNPYEECTKGDSPKVFSETWDALLKQKGLGQGKAKKSNSVELSSSLYLGLQGKTTEGIDFLDQASTQLLLHFGPLTINLYVPKVIDINSEKSTFDGFVVAIPDIADLAEFCEVFPLVCKERFANSQPAGYRPRSAIIDLAQESALDSLTQIRKHLANKEGKEIDTRNLVFGFDVLHLKKEGNNINLLGSGRVEPDEDILSDYELIKDNLKDPFFRKQRILNVLENTSRDRIRWYRGFDRLLANLPYKTHGFGSKEFCWDARKIFKLEEKKMDQDKESKQSALIYRIVRTYVLTKVEKKSGLRWEQVKEKPAEDSERKNYDGVKEKIARDAFLAVRSRTGQDFLNYFAGVIASVPQRLSADDFAEFTRWLRSNPEDARTLTLLALSAASLPKLLTIG